MRDFTIRVRHQKTEMVVLVLCFLLAFLLNVTAIIIYHTPWKELITQGHVVIFISLFLYMLTWVGRLIFLGVKTAWITLLKR
jgi:hypothetical protein